MRYAAFLRGINVGGHRPVRMADLRAAFSDMGFQGVRTVQASGNMVFEAGADEEHVLAGRIEAGLSRLFGHSIRVTVRRIEDLQHLVATAPFAGVSITPDTRLYVTFLLQPAHNGIGLSSATTEEGRSAARRGGITVVRVTPGEVLSAIKLGPGRGTPELMAFLERELGSGITTRNWDTVVKVAAA